MKWKFFFVSTLAILCLFFSTSTSNAANWYYVGSSDDIEAYVDSSTVYYQQDSSGNKNYDVIQYWQKMVYPDGEFYIITRCILSVPDRRVYQYDCTAYDYDGGEIESRNLNGTSRVIVAGSMGEREMRIVRDLAR